MVSQNVVLTTSKTLVLELESSKTKPYFPSCSLQWRNKTLWVKANQDSSRLILPALKRREWLTKCLQNSIVERVYLDERLGESGVKLWADVCLESNKKVFLRLSSQKKNLSKNKAILWQIKRFMDWWIAAILLLVLSPIILSVAILIKISTSDSIFDSQWRVGHRGKLFQIYRFRSQFDPNKNYFLITFMSQFITKLGLEHLPQLFNVVRGEMSLVGPHPGTLSDGLSQKQTIYNALPGITGTWQLMGNSPFLDKKTVNQCDMKYLNGWSLGQDLKILLMTIPKLYLMSLLGK